MALRAPGSNPTIPETAMVKFQIRWSRENPGTKQRVGFLPLESGSLAVLPYRGWTPPLDQEIECVLYPLDRSAVAAPVGGIPTEQKIEKENDSEERDLTAIADESTRRAFAYRLEEISIEFADMIREYLEDILPEENWRQTSEEGQ